VLLLSTRGLERHGRELLAAYAQHGGGILIAAGPTWTAMSSVTCSARDRRCES